MRRNPRSWLVYFKFTGYKDPRAEVQSIPYDCGARHLRILPNLKLIMQATYDRMSIGILPRWL